LCRNESVFNKNDMDADIYNIFSNLLKENTDGLEVINSAVLSRICEDDDMLKKAIDLSMIEGLPPCNEEEIRTILREIENRSDRRRVDVLRESVNAKLADNTLLPDDVDYLELQNLLRKLKGAGGRV
jgi:hypothetical protein